MKKDIQPEFSILDGDIARLVYHAGGPEDILHPFSVEGYEMLTADFMAWIDALRPMLPRRMPVLLEITGCHLTDRERQVIDNAIWTHYRIRLAEAREALTASEKKLLIFLPCFLLSILPLLLTNHISDEVLAQYLSLPFWFFSYRLLTYPIFDHLPLLREMDTCLQLAAMKIGNPDSPGHPLPEEERAELHREYRQFRKEMVRSTR